MSPSSIFIRLTVVFIIMASLLRSEKTQAAACLPSAVGVIDTDGDGLDNNCDTDDDNDGSLDTDDCDDYSEGTYPGATEVFDGLDNDCDKVDDNIVLGENVSVLGGYDETTTINFGYALAALGDVNSDGYGDFAVGSPDAALVKAYAGNNGKDMGHYDALGISTSDDSGNYSLLGDSTDYGMGYIIAGGGDFDCDGYDDMALGLYKQNIVFIVRGKNPLSDLDPLLGRGATTDDAYLIRSSVSADVDFGKSIAFLASIDGDKCDELLIGAPGTNSSAGRTYLVKGGLYDYYALHDGVVAEYDVTEIDMAIFTGEVGSDYSGATVASAGDFNGDGTDDILIGAYGNDSAAKDAGTTYLFYGKPTLSGTIKLGAADLLFRGETASDYSGRTLAGVNDMNKDGYDDFIVGASHYDRTFTTISLTTATTTTHTNVGKVYVIYGMANKGITTVKSPKGTTRTMTVKIFSLSSADAAFYGEASGDYFGSALAGVGDVDTTNNAYQDFAVGAYGNDEGGSLAGKVYLFLSNGDKRTGTVSATTADATFTSHIPGIKAGYSLAGVGDYNHDGPADFVIGAPTENNTDRAFDNASYSSPHLYMLLGYSGGGQPTSL